MNLGQIVNRTQRQVGDTSGALFTRDDIVDWANEGQLEIVRKTECLTRHKQTNVVSGDGSYELPSDYLFMKRVTLDDVTLTEVLLDDLDQQSSGVDSTGAGTPTLWYQSDNILFLFPKPSLVGTGNLDIWFIRQPATLVNDADIPEIPVWMHKQLVQYCITQAKELDDDAQGQTTSKALFDKELGEIQYELHSQPMNSYPSIRSLPGDQY